MTQHSFDKNLKKNTIKKNYDRIKPIKRDQSDGRIKTERLSFSQNFDEEIMIQPRKFPQKNQKLHEQNFPQKQ